jgi:hypothetical protein
MRNLKKKLSLSDIWRYTVLTKLLSSLFVAICLTATANAYDLKTHSKLTSLAYDRSALKQDPTLLKMLGITERRQLKLSETYLDMLNPAAEPIDRGVTEFEIKKGIKRDVGYNEVPFEKMTKPPA